MFELNLFSILIGLVAGLAVAHLAVQYQRVLIEEAYRERDRAQALIREVAEEFAGMRPELEAIEEQTAEVLKLAGKLARVPLDERMGK